MFFFIFCSLPQKYTLVPEVFLEIFCWRKTEWAARRQQQVAKQQGEKKNLWDQGNKNIVSKKYQFTLNEGELIKLYQSSSVHCFTEVIQKHLSPSTKYTRNRPFTLVFIHQVNYVRGQNANHPSIHVLRKTPRTTWTESSKL